MHGTMSMLRSTTIALTVRVPDGKIGRIGTMHLSLQAPNLHHGEAL
jgi:hypothetical protein